MHLGKIQPWDDMKLPDDSNNLVIIQKLLLRITSFVLLFFDYSYAISSAVVNSSIDKSETLIKVKMSQPSKLLTSEENQKIVELLGKKVISRSTGVVRFYKRFLVY